MKKEIVLFAIFSLSLLLIMFGAGLNITAVTSNGCRMPVYTYDYNFSSNTHFTFTNRSSVNNFYLTDIINLNYVSLSIGDILIVLGLIISMYLYVNPILVNYKKSKLLNNTDG